MAVRKKGGVPARRGRRWRGVVLATLGATLCTGCPQLAITRGAEMAASSTFDDRSYEEQVADDATAASIEKSLVEASPELAAAVNVDVYLARVMLTGPVRSAGERGQVVDVAMAAAGGGIVYDDLQIVEGGGLAADTEDFVTNKELAANLLAQEGLASQSFLHRVVNQVAYILGEADTDAQVDLAREAALGTPGVRSVVLHVEVRE